MIEPRTLRGFRDYPPALMLPRERVLHAARAVYRSFGYAPVDTPALEYAEVLLGKGGDESDRQVYRFRDQGDRDVALRFDLTVPFARFAADHVVKVSGTPFKRYAMGPVWRGENPTAGRYREFWQADFDTIGTTSVSADAEVVAVINALFTALEIPEFTVRVNNRMVLTGLLEEFSVAQEDMVRVLRSVDKIAKIGTEAAMAEAGTAGVSLASVMHTLKFLKNSNDEILAYVERDFGGNTSVAAGVGKLRQVLALAAAAGVPDERVRVDLSIARGLDYYTGTIYETFLTKLPGIGSVCSGGRYDNLAGLYTTQVLPGVGASLGVDRLLAAMGELNHPWLADKRSTPADVLVLQFDADHLADYHRVAGELRAAGLAVEVYPDAAKPKAQFAYADKRGHRAAVIAGPNEFAAGVWKVKDLVMGKDRTRAAEAELTCAPGDLAEYVRRVLARGGSA